jgi:ribosomal protein L37AE/L43A
MSHLLERYLGLGLSNIIVLDRTEREEPGGYNTDHTEETIIARKGKTFVRTTVHEAIKYFYNAGTRFHVTSETKITEKEYQQLAKGKSVIDTQEARLELEQKAERMAQRNELESQLNSLAPQCPQCRKRMVARSGKYGMFWGCASFPQCDATVRFSTSASKLYKELSSL